MGILCYGPKKKKSHFPSQSIGMFGGASFAICSLQRLKICNGDFRLTEIFMEESNEKKIAHDLPPCKKGCGRSQTVVILVQDSTRKGYVVQCGSCQAGTPVMELTEAVNLWTKEFALKEETENAS